MSQLFSRTRYLTLLDAAISAGEYRFARLAVLDWLAAYPGDLAAGLIYARALVGEQRPAQARLVLEGLLRFDPECAEALEALVAVLDADADADAAATRLFALTGRSSHRHALSTWGGALWLARRAYAQGKLELAEEMCQDALRQAPDEPLVLLFHLGLLRGIPRQDPDVGTEIADRYLGRAPDSLACMLYLASWRLEAGDEEAAVALLHQVAARDVGGQVICRLWGDDHPYRVLWPESMQAELRLSIPAAVSAVLGWNRLRAQCAPGIEAGAEQALPVVEAPIEAPIEPPAVDPAPDDADHAGPEPEPEPADSAEPVGPALAELAWAIETGPEPDADPGSPEPQPAGRATPAGVARSRLTAMIDHDRPAPRRPAPRKGLSPELQAVSKEFDRMASRLHLTAHGHLDGRYPVYVVFSLRARLEGRYGAGVAALIESEMDALAAAVGKRRGWAGMFFIGDDPAVLKPFDLSPAHSGDPWELKLLITDLDARLARRGQCIGALLIVGGPEIVPFHRLPNPMDDQDADVPSDNPYACRDENYFVPEWPVGRLPGGGGSDARPILESLRRIRLAHEAALDHPSWLARLIRRIADWLGFSSGGSGLQGVFGAAVQPPLSDPKVKARNRRSGSFGYTAAIWKAAAAQVFRPIGRAAGLQISPPLGFDGAEAAPVPDRRVPRPMGRLGYFNLHGIVDGPEWFGQCSGRDPKDTPEYPVALRPQDVLCAAASGDNPEIPLVVFTQACYGLNVDSCPPEEAMAMSFLQSGSLAVVGSTCMAYGAVSSPLTAGDLLARSFWRSLQNGIPAGEALRRAKIQLACDLNTEQGFLDGQDQKTLISFALYGDPLALPDRVERLPKQLRYQDSPLPEVRTVCDRVEAADADRPLPPEVLASVRTTVARYLPGMADARLMVARPRLSCMGEEHACPTSQLESEPRPGGGGCEKSGRHTEPQRTQSKNGGAVRPAAPSGSLVTLSKPVITPEGAHPRVARLTLDDAGKVIKIVVSR